ncbi:MAG: diguanylate cyclase [Actinobacteria bacterium]|nr:diguanylate cyclase [Actinomycetota bacterium]
MTDRPQVGRSTPGREVAQVSAAPVAGLNSAEGFRALVELSPDAIFVILDGYHVFANARGLALFGAESLADLQTRPAQSFMHPDDQPTARARMRTMVDDREVLQYVEERVVRLDGTVVDIEAAGTPITVDGRPAALVVVRDITARKQAQTELRAAQARFQAAFANAPTAILLTNADGVVIAANPALGRMLGSAIENLTGRPCWDIVIPADRHAVRLSIQRLAAGHYATVRGDFRYLRPDAGLGWMHARAARLPEEPTVIVHLLDVTAAKLAAQDLTERASRDPLTGLANRTQVLDQLSVALRVPGAGIAVLFADLDGFKQINDQHGHATGDQILIAVAQRMRAAVPATDTVGRIGGDEFAIILTGAGCTVHAADVATRIGHAIDQPISINGARFRLGVSIGVATATASDEVTAESLLAAADGAMYQAKSARTRAASNSTTPGGSAP